MEWKKFIEIEKNKDYLKKILEKLKNETRTFYPSLNKIFYAFDFFKIKETRIVILGQDPYYTKGMANGLCFSVNEEIINKPPSLQNIFKALKNDLNITRTRSDLSDWANQGVLLLNTILSVEENKPLSHINFGYDILINNVFAELKNHKHIVFCLWGKNAQKYIDLIDCENNLVLVSSHPSPLSAHKGFLDSKHFSKANEYLIKHNRKPIKW